MDKDYEKSMLIIDSIVDGITENIIDYDEYACKLIEFHLVGYEREQAYNYVID